MSALNSFGQMSIEKRMSNPLLKTAKQLKETRNKKGERKLKGEKGGGCVFWFAEIHNPLSSFPHWRFPSIHNSKQSPCSFQNSIVSYRTASGCRTDVALLFHTPTTTDKHLCLLLRVFSFFHLSPFSCFDFEVLQGQKDQCSAQHSSRFLCS